MGTLRYTFLISSVLISVSVCSQEEETIPWSSDRKLQWSDFKGSYFKTEWAAATTATGIGYSFTSTKQGAQQILAIEVQCVFLPKKSWYRPEVCNAFILGHEQLHFDIAELYARKFRKRLAAFNFTDNVKEEVKDIYKKILLELRSYQNKYDRETDFSKDFQQQLLWNQNIESALNPDI
ncbi:hypothetical protein LCGC14_1263260 [marine sediment metagenome]|uniref:DUF922 domain-containing protein n=1 Tax=marine sediment metagenome TaxID=412755 RepID=A0A0F9L011_9ZZZZ